MTIDNVSVFIENGPLSANEAAYYIKLINQHTHHKLKSVTFRITPDYMDLRYSFEDIPFERIRRVSTAEREELRENAS